MDKYPHPDIGDIRIIYSSRAKRISIRIHPEKGTSLTLPSKKHINKGIEFINSKSEWIQKKLSSLPPRLISEGIIPNLNYKLTFKKYKGKNVRLRVSNQIIEVAIPEGMDQKDDRVQSAARKAIDFALNIEAKLKLPVRLEMLAKKHGFEYSKVGITRAKTRWGSCSSRNGINLSQSLMLLPQDLIDYVLIHELVHTIHKNHGSKFWETVSKHCPQYKEYTKELKNYSTHY